MERDLSVDTPPPSVNDHATTPHHVHVAFRERALVNLDRARRGYGPAILGLAALAIVILARALMT